MAEVIEIRYDAHKGNFNAFLKQLVLTYPSVKPTERLHLFIPKDVAEARQAAEYFAFTGPNVFIYTDDSEGRESSQRELNSSLSILKATEQMLVSNGIRNPFDSGFIWPRDIGMEIDELGLTEARLAELDKLASSFEFNAHDYSVNELLGITFCIFKRLLAKPGLPTEVIPSDSRLLWFLAVCRASYNSHVPYHSYWHSVDVAQLTFALLSKDPPAWDLDPATSLALVLAALGHDMKHPGMVVQVIESVDSQFSQRWSTLEDYHLDIFETVLDQLWPCIKNRWSGVLHEAIEATEMARHHKYLIASRKEISIVHSLKISDFGSAVRPNDVGYDSTACLIFKEFYHQALMCYDLKDQFKFPPQKIDVENPACDAYVTLQIAFLDYVVLPYFRWVSDRVSWFVEHLKTAEYHRQRFEVRRERGEYGGLYDCVSWR